MKEISKINETSSTELIRYGDGDPFAEYANAISPGAIVGKLLKFSKGDYTAGEDHTEVPAGTVFVANMDELLVGWIRWEGGKPVEHAMGRVAERQRVPRRNELGYTEQSAWETDRDGKPKDPWQQTNYLLLMSAESELFTFTTSSNGGRKAIGKLCREFARLRAKHTDEWPVISLGVGDYPHDDYGKIKQPVFHLHGWWPKVKFVEAPFEGGAAATVKLQLKPPIQDALDDTIQF